MKSRLIILLLVLISFSCNNKNETEFETEFESNGIISGIDYRLCPCCRGYIIQIVDDGNNYRIGLLPDGFQINEDEIPISVKLNWEIQATCDAIEISYIDIEEIEVE